MVDFGFDADELSLEQLEVLKILLQSEGLEVEEPAIRRRQQGGDLPLSFAQQRLWFLDQLDPGSPAYNMPAAVRLRGRLDVASLRRSLTEIVRRHEVLRSRISLCGGEPRQTAMSAQPVPLPVLDLRGIPAEARGAEARRLVRQEARRPFSLQTDTLLRAALLALGREEHMLLFAMHHIAGDGWSVGVLVRELGALYQAFSAGLRSPLPELPFQYADFAVWQRERLAGELLRSQVAYWRERLPATPARAALPLDRPRPARLASAAANVTWEPPAAQLAALQALGREQGTTLFMTLCAAFQVLLARWSGAAEAAVGTPVAGRDRAEMEGLIGLFANTLVLHTDLAGEPGFAAVLARAREVVLGAFAHQEVPFDLLVTELQPERQLSATPFFQVMFLLQAQAVLPATAAGLDLALLPVESSAAKFDLTLMLDESAGHLSGVAEYRCDLFDGATIERLLGCYSVLLAGAVADPDRPVAELPLLDGTERTQLLALSGGGRSFPRPPLLHAAFAAQAGRTPDAVAVSCAGEQLTYGALNRSAVRLAHRLRRLGVGPEVPVGICAGRSAAMMTGLLAILKAGGAYVPLDPAYPRERLQLIVEDALAAAPIPVLLADEEGAAAFAAGGSLDRLRVVRLTTGEEETDEGFAGSESWEGSGGGVDADSLAYVIYTSGSTGRPKGVQVTHANASRLFLATQEPFGFGAAEVWTLFHSYAFDFSVWEIWGALLTGGRLVVVPYWVSRSPEDFRRLLSEEQVTVLNQTPSAFRQLQEADALAGEGELALRWVIFGGEALDTASLASWFDRHGDAPRLVNMYGITETTVHVTFRPLSRADCARPGSPLGVPIPDLRLDLADRTLELAPLGAPGEIVVGGAGVARGYLGRPDLTAARFVPDPFSGTPGARLYRSGDLARRRPDGALEFLGRIDSQVKIRGFRIELGEIEAALSGHPAVRQALVMVRGTPGDTADEKRLVAYVVAGVPPAADELRAFLQQRLPEHMVPVAYVPLAALPLTAQGKVDRRALPEPGREHAAAAGFEPPQTAAERALAAIWEEVLGSGPVGRQDNFFALGGDSILSIRMRSRAAEQGIGFALQDLFRHQTLAGLAAALTGAEEPAAPAPAPFSLVAPEDRGRLPAGLEDAYPLARLQSGMLFHSASGQGGIPYHNVSSVRLGGALDPAALAAAVRQLARRHPVLRTSFDLASFSEPLQLVHAAADMPFTVADLRGLPPAARQAALEEWFAAERVAPFDPRRAPLLRIWLHLLEGESCELGWAEHHAILDGWSVAAMLADLFALYRAEPSAPPSALFRDFVALEQQAAAAPESRRYWQERLAGHTVLELPRWPGAVPRPAGAPRVETLPLAVTRGLDEALGRAAGALGVPLKSVLLAAHVRALERLGGSADVVTGLVAHGRPEVADGERALGLFLNTLPLRCRRSAGGSWSALVREVFAAEMEALPHRRYPMADLQRELSGEPLFETVFNYINFHALAGIAGRGGLDVVANRNFGETNFTLLAQCGRDPLSGRLSFELLYDAGALRPEQAQAFAGFYLGALEALAGDVAGRSDLPLPEEQRHQLLVEWNDSARAWPRPPLLHAAFAAQAVRTPDAVAVTCGGEELTYGGLDRRAALLARRLRRLGVGPEVPVGICAGRSAAMVTGLLAILKAGGAYVPLDPAYPRERLRLIVEDALAAAPIPVLLADEEGAAAFAADGSGLLAGLRIVRFDLEVGDVGDVGDEGNVGDAGDEEPGEVYGGGAAADSLAYVIYTSGSTGRPKGVQVTHANACRLFLSTRELFGFGAGDVWTLFHSYAFDFSVWEIWGALLTGGRLVVVPYWVSRSPEDFRRLLSEEGVTVLNQTPSAFLQLQEADARTGAGGELALRWVVFGGEALDTASLTPWLDRHGEVPRLVNMYGITETTVHVTFRPLSRADCARPGSPLGVPIPDLRLDLADRSLELAPLGAPGEILVGGAGVARGYLGRPELTAARFVPDPFGGVPGARLYRSGDLARRRPDGALEFLGRIDSQVKIRGFRIEPGEIEAALAGHPAVRRAVAMVRDDLAGARGLVAYIEPATGVAGDVAAGELRAFLQQRLPDYMVPQAFVVLDSLPLSPSGKLDRKALPAPAAPAVTAAPAAPRTPVEELLAGIFAEVLGRERVGIDESFFAAGGHSLLAMRVVSRLREALPVEIPLQELFAAPTVAGLAAWVERALRADQVRMPPIGRVSRDGTLPLSFAQQRIYFLEVFEPGTSTYNMALRFRLCGPIHRDALAATLREIVRRHEVLRTSFGTTAAGEPMQVIHAEGAPALPCVDLRGLGDAERRNEAQRLATAEGRRPFDLAAAPLLRAVLLAQEEGDHLLLLTLHHIASDGWSLSILGRELSTLYAAFSQGLPSPLPELPIQYADFAHWQRQWLSGAFLDAEIAYWRQRLEGIPASLDLPLDRPRPVVRSLRGAPFHFQMPEMGLGAFSRRHGATLFMTLTAAFEALLSRASGQTDLCLGTLIAGRDHLQAEDLIGFFVNTLVLRADLSGNPEFTTILRQARETALGAYAHQHLPFEKLVEELAPERDLSRTPIFQVMLVLQNTPVAAASALAGPEGGTTSAEMVRLDGDGEIMTKFDLTLYIVEADGALSGSFVYSTALFDPPTIVRLAGHYERLLAAAVREPGRRLSEMPLLSDSERHQVLVEWSAVEPLAWEERCLHEVFAEQARRTPDAVAAACLGASLTYREMDRRTDRLAAYLRGLGVGPDVLVGLAIERSLEMLVAVYAVLKAGGAYVPMEPSHPTERLATLLEDLWQDGRPPVLLAVARWAGKLAVHGCRMVQVDAQWGEIEQAGPLGEAGVTTANAAYVIFTSGSTGGPKGVVVEHRQVISYVRAMESRMGLAPNSTYAMLQPLTVDACKTSVYLPLLSGGTLHLVPRTESLDPQFVEEYFIRHRIDGLKIAPSHIKALQASTRRGVVMPKRWLILGGEAPTYDWACDLHAMAPECGIFNHYGPTETTVGTMISRATDDLRTGPSLTFHIGTPSANARGYVLDADLRPVPVGVLGELYLGGPCVSRGYFRRPSMTAERFIPDPWGDGGRLYKTGDMVRHMPDGNVEFLGRSDDQIKIRGFRVELGEIETVLCRHPGVREGAVLGRPDRNGAMRLVAYYIPREPAPRLDQIQTFLRERLPDHMVPAAFVAMESFPRKAHGKMDRGALPEPEVADPAASWVAPRTLTEERMAAVWAEVLGLERVGVEESFFDLGGHSLLATRLVSRLRERLGIELPLRALFEHPTVAGLAGRIELAERGAAAAPVVRMERRGPLPLSFAQERLWIIDQLEPGSPRYNIPAVVRLHGPLHVPVFAAALDEIVRRHEVLCTTFALDGGTPVQIVAPPRRGLRPISPPIVDLSALPEAGREAESLRLARAELLRPFDLAVGPLLRAALLRLGAEDHVVLANMHHIVSDAWSVDVLIRELGTLYSAFAAGRPSPLPELAVQYADFAVWQRGWLTGEVLTAQLAYWRERLAGVPPLLELPADRPRPPIQGRRGASRTAVLPAETSSGLRALGRREGATLFMTLLGLFQALLGRHAGSDDVVVGSPIAGRTRAEIEPLIGFFVNTLALRADLSGGLRVRELLGQVRESTLGAYAHQDLPFEKLVEELAPERDLSRTPLFQVMFTVQNAPAGPLELPGLRLSTLPLPAETAKFDLTLAGSEAGERIALALQYSTELFDPATAGRLLGHFERLLRSAVAQPDSRVAELPLLTAAERAQVLQEWSDTEVPCPQVPLVHELMSRHARRRPQSLAVSGAGGRLTYGELEARSNRLAHHLRGLGVGPDVRVAVCMERTPERVIGIAAVLKAGGAYISLDPGYPKERLAYLLEDAEAPVLLTQGSLLDRLPETPAAVLCLDEDWVAVAGRDDEMPASGVLPENLAYVVYTSGSTGRPKGVEIPHAGLMNLVRWHQREYEVGPEDRGTQVASPAFDASIWELWPYLAAGASVHIPDEETRLSPAGMVRWWDEAGITLAYLPTPLAEGVLGEAVPESGRVRALIIGGDRLHRRPRPDVRFRLMNHYGPAEYSVTSTVVQVPPGTAGESLLPTIGRAVDNTRLYVLGRSGLPQPVGVPGELYVAGVGLARGYSGRPDLTAEKFVPDPFAAEPGARMYRTGDLVKWLPDGDLDFLGRLDFQVKLRGLRIELGEIETVLGQHPAVREAAVLVREDRPGDKRLVAYVALGADSPDAAGEASLRAWLGERLPEYMVPSFFVPLAALPLTPNGKVDRRALPAPDLRPDAAGSSASPRTPLEELVAGIWAAVLGVERVGVEESFFALGGHSLLATQLVSRLRHALGLELPLRAVFEAPTVEALCARIGALDGEARGLAAPPITPAPRQGPLPLSFTQQRFWFLHQMEPESPVYNLPTRVRLRGALRIDALAAALTGVVGRHEALRTTFNAEGGEPVQVIVAEGSVPLPVLDLSGLPAPVREAESRRLLEEEGRRPFDLRCGPLLRAHLVALGTEDHLALLTMHHIVSDAWSMEVLVRELGALYSARVEGRPASLPPLALQYADFAVWQRQWLSGAVLEAELGYWRERLEDALVSDLPTDRPRPAVQTFAGTALPFALRPGLSSRLQALSRERSATLFMTLLAAFQALLGRYAGLTEVSVGTPVSGRNRLQTEELIGCFINTLVLRTGLADDPAFADLAERVRELSLAAYAHQDLPFEKVVQELLPQRDPSRSPLFQVMFSWQSAPQGLDLPGVTLEPVDAPVVTAKFDLTLSMLRSVEAGGRLPGFLEGFLEYNRDLFDETTAARMIGHFETLLESVAAHPELCLSVLPLLTSGEMQQMLAEWNDTRAPHPLERPIHELFERQAARTPEAPAVLFVGAVLTYRELDRRSNQLAHRLRRLGVGPEVRVAICLARGLDLAVALLGVLKAGGAYVPLDPEYPQERLAFMLADSGASVLVTEEALCGALPAYTAAVVSVDGERAAIAAESEAPPASGAGPENLAYIIYTSGSTATPKGVLVPHRAYVNHNAASAAYYEVGPGDRFLQFASISFDVAGEEFFIPWLSGAAVVLHADPAGTSFEQYLELVAAEELTILNLPASFWHDWVEELSRSPRPLPPSLRVMIVGNEKALPERFAAWRRLIGRRVRSTNAYGPTEDTVTTTIYESALGPEEEVLRTVPIGRPLANKQVCVLDGEMRPVPVGVPGELYVGGAGLARGYLGRPDLTVEKFVPNPFGGLWGAPGGRLYRTGDLARFLPDGNVEFLGRVDHQVKIRGFRIELEEIETVLRRHPAVGSAVVLAREDQPGNKRLVAYLVGMDGEAAAPLSELRRFVRERLPEYMVPAAFVTLPAWPLTPNGKLDRKALPAPEAVRVEEETAEAPRTPAEELVAGIWAEVLGRERVGRAESFFELGGHSLLATRVISRVREVFGTDVPLRALFEHPTVEGLARQIERAERGAAAAPVTPADRRGALPLSFAQERLWIIDQLEPGSARYNVPAVVRLHGPLDIPVFAAALDEIVRRHEALRTTFALAGDAPVQVIAPPRRSLPPAPLPIIDLGALPETGREAAALRLARAELLRPFDLAAGPLLRAALLRLGAEDHVVLANMHHIVSDGWSVDVLTRELGALYGAFAAGRPSPLPEPAVQYADFAVWQRGWLTGEVLASQLAYWRQRLAGAPPFLELPADRPRPAVQGPRGGSQPLWLPAELAAGLRALGRREGTTLFMTLLGLFQALLGRHAGSDDVVVGSPIAGRTRAEIEPLIGFFVNTLALRADLSGGVRVRELLGRTRESALGAYAHQDLPFEKLVEELAPERALARTPLFQVMFTVQNAPAGALELPGLRLSGLPLPAETSKFDLTLSASEAEGRIAFSLQYSTDLFDPATIRRLLGHLERLLRSAVAQPDSPVAELPLLSDAERAQVLQEWNDTARAWPPGCLHELFEAQADRCPAAPAVVSGDGTGEALSYGELERRANRLAHRLRASGVGPEVRVALCIERSPAMVAAVLGVLKAGGAYVPLDPELPAARLALLLEDSGAAVVIAGEPLRGRFAGFAGPVLPAGDGAASWPATRPQPAASPENLAYVVYTSGSTGRPKGVLGTHRGAHSYLRFLLASYGVGPADRVLQLPALTFDASVRDLLGTLAAGATVVLINAERAKDPAALLEAIEHQQVTRLLSVVPTMLRGLVAAAPPAGGPRSVRQVLVSGERLSLADCARARGLFGPELAIVNQYGPTETTMTSSYHPVDEQETAGRGEALLGRPIANSRFYILRDQGVLAPLGSFGELHIGGIGLARGYLDRPDLTAEAFRPDPFSGVPGARLYRTGDLVRHLADGTLELLGRIDHQVKLRGFRVEPGEIESALAACPGVQAAAVVVRDDLAGGHGLIAYVVPAAGETGKIAPGELRSLLQQRLPDYMVPQLFVELGALPLTPHGKLDRKALPKPEWASGDRYAGPRDLLELELVQLWESLLNVRPIGIRDNFFALGGHSLLAVRLLAGIRQRFERALTLATLFENGTVETQASLLRTLPDHCRRSPLIPIQTGGTRPPFFAVHPAGGSVLCYAALAGYLGPDQPFYGLEATGLAEGGVLGESVEEMAACYLEALREAQPEGPYRLGGWSFGGLVAFEMARRLRAGGEEVQLLVLLDTLPPASARPAEDDDVLLLSFAETLAREAGQDVEPLCGELLRQPPDRRLEFLFDRATQAGLLPPGTGLSQARRILDVTWANTAARQAYAPQAQAGHMVFFRARERQPEAIADEILQWSALAEGGVEVCEVPGDHSTILSEPHIREVAKALALRLASPPNGPLTPGPDRSLWTREQIETALAEQRFPGWAADAYVSFKARVLDPLFPCTFGIVAQQRGTLLYAMARSLQKPADRRHIQCVIAEYLERLQGLTKEEASFILLILFVDPQSLPPELAAHQGAVWDLLQFLHEEDGSPWPADVSTDPDHPLWSFCLAGSPLFINISSPAHQQRRSRNLGSALTLVVQLREGFDLVAPDTPTGRRTRKIIRDRIADFDQVPPHPELGYYKDPRNREWKQYGIPDGAEPLISRCPFHKKKE